MSTLPCPCGLSKEDLKIWINLVDASGVCMARRKDKSKNVEGSFILCGELAADHPSATTSSTQGNYYLNI
jgi:hypothetical protein